MKQISDAEFHIFHVHTPLQGGGSSLPTLSMQADHNDFLLKNTVQEGDKEYQYSGEMG